MVDLHVHSTSSDGSFTPTELVDYAITKNLTAFALTDHDTVAGLDEAISYADSLRAKGILSPRIIPGIEFSTEYEGRDVHIVGLFVDYKCDTFKEYMQDFIKSRNDRNLEMCEKFQKNGIDISYEALVKENPNSTITRAHIANYMVKIGLVKHRNEAFDRFIGDHAPYYIPRKFVTPEKAIDLILRAGGIPVFAHPILCHLAKEKLDALVKRLKAAGLMGIEAIYSTYEPSEERQIRALASKYHLLLSGGSDFHGKNKDGIDLAVGRGKLNVPDEILENIEKSKGNFLFTDMDGTLLLKDCTISENMKNALVSMVSKGHHLVLTTGRPLPSVLERKVNLGLNFPNMYLITNNGGLIYDCDKEQSVFELMLSSQAIKKAENICKELKVHIHSYTATEIVGYEDDEELKFYRSRIKMPFIKVSDISAYLTQGSYKIQIIHLSDKAKLERVKEKIEAELSKDVDCFFSNDNYLEVLPKGCSKGAALTWLCDYLSVPKCRSFAAGDENNDIPMLKAAGTKIAVLNAAEAVKAAADIVTDFDNNHDGLIQIINEYF